MEKTKLTILILNYKTRGLLRQFLKGLRLYKPTCNHEIIVVDNKSDDGSIEMLNDYSEVKVIQNKKNLGYTKGNNIGIREAKGEYILLINSDVVITNRTTIDELVKFLDDNPDVGAVGPALKNADGTVQESAYHFYRFLTPLYRRTFLGRTKYGKAELARSQMKDWDRKTSRDVDWLMSSCLMLRKKTLDEVGLLDERFFLYVSEEDLCRRIWQTGSRVHFYANASLIHYHRKQSADDFKVALIHISDFIKYLWKWRGK